MLPRKSIRAYAPAIFALSGLLFLGACADTSTVAPVVHEKTTFHPANFSQVGSSVVFRVDNSQGIVKQVGSHVLYVPAGAICDLVTSGYGSAMWDAPCDPMQGSLLITATVFTGPQGEPYVDFQPHMRFAPDKDVMLFLTDAGTTTPQELSVKYCNDLGVCVDESVDDESLRPFHIANSSIIGRRVKHFSGYWVTYEGACLGVVVDNGDGTYFCESAAGLNRRSGYMVASGEDITDVVKDSQNERPRRRGKNDE
jgi:hypothetical protein